ncbi:hypothetical protein ASPVEDRAFT_763299 [Aspergillus versicolor CBS 583.65]|uniref:Uncharacterized protein n=1 Tax=Aspergillus versicolor CBS 583.65 TaxID=1036611 RepID=A0A1L9PQU8_ASPVE|nr:uncharacterized protein ASPVEDRAFT_763299 [Aspergillus versicolor CBS 583.65]OJJ03928.1 hypothetical protein ASPVEDRAFT_763299 [Aspergillus versicolor CBS 583.65]
MSSQPGLRRRDWTTGHGLRKVLDATTNTSEPKPIAHPPTDVSNLTSYRRARQTARPSPQP